MTRYSENVLILLLSGFFFFHIVEFMILMPLGPQLMTLFGIGAQKFSYLVAVYNFSAAISGILGVFWMDRYDRKRMLLCVNFCFAVGTTACFLSTSYIGLLLSRMITGAFGGMIGALSMTIIGDMVPFERRGFAMSKLMSGYSLAAIFGVPLGLTLAHHYTWEAPFIFVSFGTFCFLILSFFYMPSMTGHIKKIQSISKAEIFDLLTDPTHVTCFFFMSILMMVQFLVIPFISPSLIKNGVLGESQLPLIYIFGGGLTAISNPLIGKLSDRYQKTLLFQICALLCFLPIYMITHIEGSEPVWLVLCFTSMFFVFSSGRMVPVMALLTSVVNPEKRGRFMSLNGGIQQISSGLAVAMAGHIIFDDPVSGRMQGYGTVGFISIGFGLVSLFWVYKIRKKAI